jgi:hypothetical protein
MLAQSNAAIVRASLIAVNDMILQGHIYLALSSTGEYRL